LKWFLTLLFDFILPVQLAKCLQKIAKENTCADEQVVKATLDLLMAASELRGRSTGALTLLTRDVLSLLGPIEEVCILISQNDRDQIIAFRWRRRLKRSSS